MASSSRYVPSSFFMFCKGDFAAKLSLPAAFMEEHKLHLRKQLTLQLKTEPGRRSWTVKIKKINGIYYFIDGWAKFVDDNGILESKVVVFHLIGDSTLFVSIFGLDSCLELPPSSSNSASSSDDEDQPLERNSDEDKGTWRCIKKLKDYNVITDRRIDIPKKFAFRSGIATKQETMLEDWRGRKWPVSITDRNRGRFSLCGGWTDFLKGNELRPETILLFEYMAADNVIKVEIMDNEKGEKLCERAEKGGFLESLGGIRIRD